MTQTPTYHESAQAHVGSDAICRTWAQAVESLGDDGREKFARANERHHQLLEADPQVQEEREAAVVAREAIQASLAAGESPEVAHERAKKACGRTELRFDYSERAEELRREAFREAFTEPSPPHDTTHAPDDGARIAANGNGTVVRRAQSSGKPRTTPRARRVDKTSEDDEPHEPAPAERRCRNPRCGRPFSAQDRRRRYCEDCRDGKSVKEMGALRQQVRRDPLTDDDPDVAVENGVPGLAPECSCGSELAEADYVLGYYRCPMCGRKRPEPEALRLPDRGGKDKVRARTFVTVRNPKPGTLKRKRRYPVTVIHADGSQETVSRAELVRRAEGVVAA